VEKIVGGGDALSILRAIKWPPGRHLEFVKSAHISSKTKVDEKVLNKYVHIYHLNIFLQICSKICYQLLQTTLLKNQTIDTGVEKACNY
jgi:hypothetical protein